MNVLFTILGLLIFAAAVVFLAFLQRVRLGKKKIELSFTVRVLAALVLGLAIGITIQAVFGENVKTVTILPDGGELVEWEVVLKGAGADIYAWINVVGSAFVKLLQFVVVPLVAVSITAAISKTGGSKDGAKKSLKIIAFLLVTTAISAVIAIGVTKLFNLSASHLIRAKESSRQPTDIPTTILNLIPSNLVGAFTANSVLPVVLISALFGGVYLAVNKSNPSVGSRFKSFIETAHEFVTKIVEFVIDLTPYGVVAIVATAAAVGSTKSIEQLGFIILASFAAMAVVFVLHLVLLFFLGAKPINYLKKAGPALLFAFSSRSSAATLPLTVTAQRRLGVDQTNANLAATFGTCIGQNGCAGVFPTMLAILVGLAEGWNVWSVYFIVPLVIYVVIASIGTAGVGGGATQVSLVVLSLLGLPVNLVAVLLSVDFIIDMGRTLLNVNDSILAGFFAGNLEKNINRDVLNDKIDFEEIIKQEKLEQSAGGNI
ncbi:MAG: cation:dicarboxylase symporter family transporter [Clostridiales bacterium]|jgi:L-cystine uptake protein TcyP (sodium:dicarboxylate symporter family)|nr:cation:dicarboxylase symporter family transporter [Clostridiales bacterium]